MSAKGHTLGGLLVLTCLCIGSIASAQTPVGLSHYGVPGYIDMPSGFALPDGTVAFSANGVGADLRRGAIAFQVSPRLMGLFRYSYLGEYFPDGSLYDRSFDVRFLLAEENLTGWMPAISIGLQDFGGTGVLGAEYIAVSKHFGDDVTGTIGIGWGRFGSHNGFENPLAIFSDALKTRPGFTGVTDTGRVAFDRFFRGDAALFAGADWRPTEQLRLSLEYSSDAMTQEVDRMGYNFRMPFNLGAQYDFGRGGTLGVSFLNGSTLGVSYSLALNATNPSSYSGREPGPPGISPGSLDSPQAWTPRPDPERYARLKAALAGQGIFLQGIEVRNDVAVIDVQNDLWPAAAQAYGRTAAVLSARLPSEISVFRIRILVRGMPITEVALRRRDLEELEHAFDGSWQSYVRARISDAALSPGSGQWHQTADLSVFPYVTPFLFDPDNPVRADAGIAIGGDWSPAQGFYLSGAVNKKIVGNLDEANRPSDSTLPHVRSDAWLYSKESELYIPYLTAGYFWRPGEDLYARISGGMLERMFGGVSGELLWTRPGQRFAFGMDLNYARQRNFDGGFGFQDYDVVTGFMTGYYDFGDGFQGQVDIGRYLAKDWGSTFAMSRRFNNGFELGAFFTLTDVSFEDFGEGSFDKGIGLTIPLSWFTGKPSRNETGILIRPILRDGGAQLQVSDRLYDLTRPDRQEELASRWGQFWR